MDRQAERARIGPGIHRRHFLNPTMHSAHFRRSGVVRRMNPSQYGQSSWFGSLEPTALDDGPESDVPVRQDALMHRVHEHLEQGEPRTEPVRCLRCLHFLQFPVLGPKDHGKARACFAPLLCDL